MAECQGMFVLIFSVNYYLVSNMNKNKQLYFGWFIVVSASLIVFLSMGLRMGIGPFIHPIMDDLKLSRTELSLIVSIGMIFYGIGMPIAGILLKSFNTRIVLLMGLAVVCLSIIWTVYSKGMLSFLLSYGVFLSIGLAFLSSISLSPIISKWFVRQRGKALFYLTTGGMAGLAVMTPVETWLIGLVGWKNTLLLFGGFILLIVLPSSIFIMREDVPDGADGPGAAGAKRRQEAPEDIGLKDALKTTTYWKIVFALFACGFGMNLLGSHGVPMLMDHHFAPMTASFGVGVIGIVAIFGTVFLGQLADRFPRKNILFLIFFVRGLGFFGLVLAVSSWQLFLVSAVGGLVWAGSVAMATAILGDLYGVRLLGILNGLAYFVGHQIGAAIGSFLGGWGYEVFGTHLFSFSAAGILALLASLASITLPQNLLFSKNIKFSEKHKMKTGQ
ncbi:MFS transporter [Neobacillus mesonae]|uniref:MFS transporter n=1 Tax=Neobacillus mesonae TaxID=1193713 RepID=UPI00203E96CE|nr:MFS transporter [Neobacillus mesonae]MCM3570525.1 MFS transporter [Neobacillus mesonae]